MLGRDQDRRSRFWSQHTDDIKAMGLDEVTQKGAYIKETRGPRIVLWSTPTFRGKKSSRVSHKSLERKVGGQSGE